MDLPLPPELTAKIANYLYGHKWYPPQIDLTSSGSDEEDFLRGKLQAAQYFFHWELPKTAAWAKVLAPIDRTCLDADPAWL